MAELFAKFEIATFSLAVSINILDMKIPQDKMKILKEWDQQADCCIRGVDQYAFGNDQPQK